jgi:uncharacterized protein (TIGR03086 family)
MFDLGPAAQRMATLLDGVADEHLGARTPCEEYTVGDLVEHIGGLANAFAASAAKEFGSETSQAPVGDASRLAEDWRTAIPAQLIVLAEAWAKPDAWEGLTQAGGVELPAAVMGQVALNELVIHGWDLARATGQAYDPDEQSLQVALGIVTPQEGASRGPFGPVVDVPADAPLLDRVIAMSGRDPR